MLYEYRDSCASFEEAAQAIVEDYFNLFRSKNDEPEFALIRIFQTMGFDKLTPELQASAKLSSGHFLTLMGTIGIEEAWCDRRQSQSRKAIPINQSMSPMFKGIFRELGFTWEDVTGDEVVVGQKVKDMSMIRFFHVEDVHSSSYITDQEQFVHPYGIQSAIAIGTQFISNAAYVLIGFSTQTISEEQAGQLTNIAPYISTLLAIFDGNEAFWAG
ncbi:MAG: hypothetical protein Q9P01_19460 [Anaerolineae bacterium]|nr:hypothetical protein [Anaerolineae bacterium]MDQ7036930.1 hypothetical protein [Anaerolineae bacterium]